LNEPIKQHTPQRQKQSNSHQKRKRKKQPQAQINHHTPQQKIKQPQTIALTLIRCKTPLRPTVIQHKPLRPEIRQIG
ncbi:hypothetical protein ACTHTZ_11740, partial [Neisseria sp. P0013.S007]|uniref:hypothetical protein n=1 Tax=Neisseria sp. P0013.S007 TaxID=3436743 RepID=UPI003F7E2FD8